MNEQEREQFIQALTERLKTVHHLMVVYEVRHPVR